MRFSKSINSSCDDALEAQKDRSIVCWEPPTYVCPYCNAIIKEKYAQLFAPNDVVKPKRCFSCYRYERNV